MITPLPTKQCNVYIGPNRNGGFAFSRCLYGTDVSVLLKEFNKILIQKRRFVFLLMYINYQCPKSIVEFVLLRSCRQVPLPSYY